MRPVIVLEKEPVVPGSLVWLSERVGLALVDQQMPLEVIVNPPSEITFPPPVAVVDVIPVTALVVITICTPGGVTSAHVGPTRISSISTLGVVALFLKQMEAKVAKAPVPLLFETDPEGSAPPRLAGFTQRLATVGEALLLYLTTTR